MCGSAQIIEKYISHLFHLTRRDHVILTGSWLRDQD
jgi:hypothetical protein